MTSSSIGPIFNSKGVLINEDLDMAHELNNYFFGRIHRENLAIIPNESNTNKI